jgi:hypothetical protein
MSERVTIGFADLGGAVQGIAIAGAGALLAAGGRVEAAPAATLTDDGGAACRVAGAGAYELMLEPLGPPADLGEDARVWICRARGTAGGRQLDGVGHITRSQPGERVVLERNVIAWLGPELAVALDARRAGRARGHGDEELHAAILRGAPLTPATVMEPRLSTTYDGDGHLLRCGLELWEDAEADFAVRYGGAATAHGELVGEDGSRTRVAFIAWRGDRGEHGVGHYEITES